MARDVQITVDCADPGELAAFWAETLGYRLQDPPKGFESWEQALEAMGVPPESGDNASAMVDPEGSGPRLFFPRVPERKQTKNRVHLDVRPRRQRVLPRLIISRATWRPCASRSGPSPTRRGARAGQAFRGWILPN
ncbi:VOC family protein [Nonomuraea sp. CA-143628]|uniref:VOC family protein n=1 Tax=Nonomuraea sp. CA-143628 TaxID=3239997 RepID=UPI003D910CFD